MISVVRRRPRRPSYRPARVPDRPEHKPVVQLLLMRVPDRSWPRHRQSGRGSPDPQAGAAPRRIGLQLQRGNDCPLARMLRFETASGPRVVHGCLIRSELDCQAPPRSFFDKRAILRAVLTSPPASPSAAHAMAILILGRRFLLVARSRDRYRRPGGSRLAPEYAERALSLRVSTVRNCAHSSPEPAHVVFGSTDLLEQRCLDRNRIAGQRRPPGRLRRADISRTVSAPARRRRVRSRMCVAPISRLMAA